jgi:hypothetical protein
MFYKGFTIEEIRAQGDQSMFSRVVGYQANHPRGTCFKAPTLGAVKFIIREHLAAKQKEAHHA